MHPILPIFTHIYFHNFSKLAVMVLWDRTPHLTTVGCVVETAPHVRLYPEYLLGDIYPTDTISSAVFLQEHVILTSQKWVAAEII